MTTIDSPAPGRLSVPRGSAQWNRSLLALTAVSVVLTVITGVAIFTDSRVLTGVPIWLKPFKFSVSFVFYAWTIAWMLAMLPRRSRVAERSAVVIVAMLVIEMAVITTQVVRGTTSHYNVATPFDATLWSVMGSSIMVLFLAHVLIAVVALRQRIPDRATAYAIRLGLVLALLGMAVAFLMTSRQTGLDGVAGAHAVGVPDGGPRMPVTGWSTTGGDLRIAHFVGLHGLQAVPLLADLIGRSRRWSERGRARLVLIGAGAYGVLVVLLTWQALRAQPLLRPDATTMIAFAALAAVTAVAWTVTARERESVR